MPRTVKVPINLILVEIPLCGERDVRLQQTCRPTPVSEFLCFTEVAGESKSYRGRPTRDKVSPDVTGKTTAAV